MTKSQWENLKAGQWIKFGEKGTPRQILSISTYNGKTGAITLKQIGYSYLDKWRKDWPEARRVVTYVSCDCRNFTKIENL